MFITQITTLEEKIFSLYANNSVKKWNSNLETAQLFVMHANSNNIRTSLLKNDVNLRKSSSNWQSDQYIMSAFLFCLENKKNNEAELKSFICNSMYYFAPIFLTNDIIVKNSFSSIIIKLNLGELFSLQVVQGFVQYLTVARVKENTISKLKCSKNKNNIDYLDTVHQILHLFPSFSDSFIRECTSDCKMLGNLAPLSLALHVLYVNSISDQNYTILVYDIHVKLLEFNKNVLYKELKTFKKQLISLKLVNSKFIYKCYFFSFQDQQKKIPFHKYYSSFDRISTFKSLPRELKIVLRHILTLQFLPQDLKYSIFIPIKVIVGVGGLAGVGFACNAFGTNPSRVLPIRRTGEPHTAMSTTFAPSLNTLPTFNNASFHYSLARKGTIVSSAKRPPITTVINLNDLSKVSIVEVHRGYVDIGNKRHFFSLVMVDGDPCFSILGTSGRYTEMDNIHKILVEEIQKRFPHHTHIMDKICERKSGQSLSLDHTATSPIRSVFRMSKSRAYTVTVPGVVVNGLRTNNRIGFTPFSEYDFRPNPANVIIGQGSAFNGFYTFRSLYEEGIELSFWMWQGKVKSQQPEISPFFQFFSRDIHIGVNECVQDDLIFIDEFFRSFGASIDDPESVLMFQHESLTQSKIDDIYNLKKIFYRQEKTTNRIVVKAHAVEEFLKSATIKHKLGRSFENIMPNKEFLKHMKSERIRRVRETTAVVEGCLLFLKNQGGFDSEIVRIQAALDQFKQSLTSTDLYSPAMCHYLISNEIQLGNFYTASDEYNGNICDYTVKTAQELAKKRNQPESLYVQKNKDFLHPENSIPTVDSMYAEFSNPLNVLELLQKLKLHVPERLLDKMVMSLHFFHDPYCKAIASPNTIPEVEQWFVDNLHPTTISYLKNQTKAHEARLIALRAKPGTTSFNSRPGIISFNDEAKLRANQETENFADYEGIGFGNLNFKFGRISFNSGSGILHFNQQNPAQNNPQNAPPTLPSHYPLAVPVAAVPPAAIPPAAAPPAAVPPAQAAQ